MFTTFVFTRFGTSPVNGRNDNRWKFVSKHNLRIEASVCRISNLPAADASGPLLDEKTTRTHDISDSDAVKTRKTSLRLVFRVFKARRGFQLKKASYRLLGRSELTGPILLVPPAG